MVPPPIAVITIKYRDIMVTPAGQPQNSAVHVVLVVNRGLNRFKPVHPVAVPPALRRVESKLSDNVLGQALRLTLSE